MGSWRETHAQAVLDVSFHLGVEFSLSVLPVVGHVLYFRRKKKSCREIGNGRMRMSEAGCRQSRDE